ncbi:MAG: GNAT family N-acetyltransferase [Spirochaetaceae bacterium]|nr:GNAT family N-acetyltransferase [Spirochaetaceae bacterium]
MGDYTVAAHRERGKPAPAVRQLHHGEGWWPLRSIAQIDAFLAGSPAVGAWHRGELVGFARAVIDTHLRAYIEDAVVDRAHRRRGVTTKMPDRLMVELGSTHLV